jgi:hypothetical protein
MDFIGVDIRNKIKELGRLWKSSGNRLSVSIDILNSWDTLISEWAKDESMPLIIRKGSSRGQEFTHSSGRKVIISDNTFALWVFRNVLDGKTYSLLELKNKLNNNEIPMVYALTKEDKKKAKYTKILGKDALSNANVKWKLCHIEPVGLNNRKNIEDLDINEIVKYFMRYANPMNMFILPKEIGGLGEIQEFIDEQRY